MIFVYCIVIQLYISIEHVYKQCNHISSVSCNVTVIYCNVICWASAINATDAFIYVYGNVIDYLRIL